MQDEAVRGAISTAFDYCYLHDDWVTPLEEALAGLSAEAASWTPGPESKSIWEIVLHVANWNENMVERVSTGQQVRPPHHWPPQPENLSEEEWELAKKRLWDSLSLLKQTIDTAPFASLENSYYGLPDLLVRFSHIAYHIGQITKLREWIEARG